MVAASDSLAIRAMYKTGEHTKTELAKRFGCCPQTITHVLTRSEDKDVYSRTSNPVNLLIMPYRNQIREWLKKADLKIENVYQKLMNMGAVLSRSTVGRAVKAIKHELDLSVIRYETTPGQQAQVDWGEFPGYKVLVDGVEKPVYALFLILGYSRTRYVEFTTEMTCKSLIHSLENGLRYFGGTPKELLFDNMPQVVNRCLVDRTSHKLERELVPQFVSFSHYCDFDIVLTRVRRPQEKGKVERFVGFFKDSFMPLLEKKTGHNLEDLNSRALLWCDKVNSQVHGTTGEKPCDRLPNEDLKPLPEVTYFQDDKVQVHRDGSIYYHGYVYSVNSTHAGEEGRIIEKGNSIFCIINNELVILGKRNLPVYIRKRYSRTEQSVKHQKQKKPKSKLNALLSRFAVSQPSIKYTRSFYNAHFGTKAKCAAIHIPVR